MAPASAELLQPRAGGGVLDGPAAGGELLAEGVGAGEILGLAGGQPGVGELADVGGVMREIEAARLDEAFRQAVRAADDAPPSKAEEPPPPWMQ